MLCVKKPVQYVILILRFSVHSAPHWKSDKTKYTQKTFDFRLYFWWTLLSHNAMHKGNGGAAFRW